MSQLRSVPLIVVASTSATVAEDVAARLRRDGSVVYVTHSAEGCLRVATNVGPDIVLVDPSLSSKLMAPSRLMALLRAHPATTSAQILYIDAAPRPALRAWPARSAPPAAADPHAA